MSGALMLELARWYRGEIPGYTTAECEETLLKLGGPGLLAAVRELAESTEEEAA